MHFFIDSMLVKRRCVKLRTSTNVDPVNGIHMNFQALIDKSDNNSSVEFMYANIHSSNFQTLTRASSDCMNNLVHCNRYWRAGAATSNLHVQHPVRYPFWRQFARSFKPQCPAMSDPPDYDRWTKESLVERVKHLEQTLAHATTSNLPSLSHGDTRLHSTKDNGTQPDRKKQRTKRKLDPSKYSTRPIALKLAYLGKKYNGFEYQSTTATSTIEEELWKALVKSCLITPDQPEVVDFAPWEYSKCGRTDRGVSAFGQVIGITVRSNRPLLKACEPHASGQQDVEDRVGQDNTAVSHEQAAEGDMIEDHKPEWDPIADEMPYCRVLNNLLPPDIRVLAWCPNLPPNFSARFSCRERQYRYFFTQPAFTPALHDAEVVQGNSRMQDGWLHIDAMREAAKKFEGLHDFRNFCKVDPGKQMTNFTRRIFESDIIEVNDVVSALPYLNAPEVRQSTAGPFSNFPKVFYFKVRGSAFLWHQIRHMVAILFAVGQGLEPASIVSELLDVKKFPGRPNYNMADEVPLVLWDCVFPSLENEQHGRDQSPGRLEQGSLKDALDWIWLGEDNPLNLHGPRGLVNHLWQGWREKKMDELLANRLLDHVAKQADLSRKLLPEPTKMKTSQPVYEGGNGPRAAGKYVPVLKRQMLRSHAETNDKYAQSMGFANAQDMTSTQNWRSEVKAAKKRAQDGSAASIDDINDL